MKNDQDKPNPKKVNTALKYTGLGFQMMAVIGLSVWGGIKLDEVLHTKPIFTVVLSLIGVAVGIFIAIKDFIKPDKK